MDVKSSELVVEPDGGNQRLVDSDDEDNTELVRGGLSADETYDPQLDVQDAKWVQQRRKEYFKLTQHKTDAILSCPACFTIVCFDCQQHSSYKTQFRAMFVENVAPVRSRTVPVIDAKGDADRGSIYHPAVCGTCVTQLGVYEPAEDVYHFTNVLPSQ